MTPSRSKPIGASHLMREMDKDPEVQAARAKLQAEMDIRSAEWRKAELPLAKELQAAGYDVDSAWDLKQNYETYDSALPILVDHLDRDYPDRVREGIARALSVRKAQKWWPELKRHYIEATLPDAKTGLAQALMRTSTPDTADELVPLIADESNGGSRTLLLSSLKKSRSPETRRFLEDLRSHPTLHQEAKRIVDGKRY